MIDYSNSYKWLEEIKDDKFKFDFHLFAGLEMDTKVYDLEPQEDYEEWLRLVRDEIISNKNDKSVCKRINEHSVLCMKYDGKYSAYDNFIKHLVAAYKTSDPLIWRRIKMLMETINNIRNYIIDYNSRFLEMINVELENDSNRLIFASILQNNSIACDLLDIAIAAKLIDTIKMETEHKNITKSAQPFDIQVDEFLRSSRLFESVPVPRSILESSILSIACMDTRRKIEKYFQLLMRFRNTDPDLKEMIITCEALHTKYGSVASIEMKGAVIEIN
eukprot:NODE_274_length_12130_cov_0.238800.p4 type:complete len:275 gc:universal NODE_274_length_12130_cov_0.238800:1936-1112(-)